MTKQNKPVVPDTFITPNGLETIEVPAKTYLKITKPARIKEYLSIVLSSHSYFPRIDDLQSDWVASVAVPAFKLFRFQRADAALDSFCSIGTGSGLDVLSAVEILGATRVGLTDVHEEVVATAADNVSRNRLASNELVIESGCGDLLSPLRHLNTRYDLIYENLPNVPLPFTGEIAEDRKSSTHLVPRTEELPELIRNQMLDLHYLALIQAKDFLNKDGSILSTLGGRVPLHILLSLGILAGYSTSFLIYTWKNQADPEEVIRDHALKQNEGFGPFYFYRSEVLEKTFSSIDIRTSGREALEIERLLWPERLDAVSAYAALKKGERIGHTVAVLKSELRQPNV
jgi:methylase of polypeptide subunit release factors